MMMQAYAVIGAGFGDEAKGLFTDHRAHSLALEGHGQVWVARFNGGAQAGHTVHTPEGQRHVFHHLGSGAFSGAATYLGPRFVCHPMLFLAEHESLRQKGACTKVMVDRRALMTLPCDVMLNQAIEAARGMGKHGSCGVGFGETLERSQHPEWAVRVQDLNDLRALEKRWLRVTHEYVPQRLKALGLGSDALDPWLHHPGVQARYFEDVAQFHALIAVGDPSVLRGRTVVFEGAQGLRLDEDLGHFPHVTRSKTGLPYLLELATEMGVTTLEGVYATRAYATRHGAGPFPDELPGPPAPRFSDATNQPNAYQDALRFAHLDVDVLAQFMAHDEARSPTAIEVHMQLAVSCLDQMGPTTAVRSDGQIIEVPTGALGDWLAQALGRSCAAQSWGPTRATVHTPPVRAIVKKLHRA